DQDQFRVRSPFEFVQIIKGDLRFVVSIQKQVSQVDAQSAVSYLRNRRQVCFLSNLDIGLRIRMLVVHGSKEYHDAGVSVSGPEPPTSKYLPFSRVSSPNEEKTWQLPKSGRGLRRYRRSRAASIRLQRAVRRYRVRQFRRCALHRGLSQLRSSEDPSDSR